MIKKILTLTILLFLVIKSAESKNNIEWNPSNRFSTLYDNYALVHPSDTKMQFGFKYSMLGSIYFTYNQIFWWDLFSALKPSSVIKDVNYMPGVMGQLYFYRGPLRYFRIGYEHKSNGKGGIDNRTRENAYATTMVEIPFGDYFSLTWENRWNYYWKLASENHDLRDYVGMTYQRFEFKIVQVIGTSKIRDQALSFAFMGLDNKTEFSFTVGTKFRLLVGKLLFKNRLHPLNYIEYQRGYWNSLLDYDHFDNIIRGGVILQ